MLGQSYTKKNKKKEERANRSFCLHTLWRCIAFSGSYRMCIKHRILREIIDYCQCFALILCRFFLLEKICEWKNPFAFRGIRGIYIYLGFGVWGLGCARDIVFFLLSILSMVEMGVLHANECKQAGKWSQKQTICCPSAISCIGIAAHRF